MLERIITNFRLLNSSRPENWPFDFSLMRDEEQLAVHERDFIAGWSVSGFGAGGIFYLFARNLYEPLGVLAVTGFVGRFFNEHWAHSLNDASVPTYARTALWFLVIMVSISWTYAIYFLARHGRRLSWNRCAWNSVEELRRSERVWFWCNFVASVVFLGIIQVVFTDVER